MSTENKNIVIIGGSTGVGSSLIKQLGKEGANLHVYGRTESDEMKEAGANYNSFDVLKDELNNLPEEIHGLVYLPGSINLKPFNRLKDKDFSNDFEINVLGAVKVLQACHDGLKKAKGSSVVLYSTVAVGTGMNFHASIAAAKGALEGLGRSLAAEWASTQIRVNLIAPSLTDTPLAKKLLSSEDKKEASDKRHPIGRVGEASDIASISAFLLSSQSSWITGQVIGVDGGMGNLKPL
ncbi:MAG: SDR family oxidoreductase [Cyclobacteriaceae bacterium]|nr:SDR family oxidoreductase [Cyclobacteriaceae bacterium]MCH8516562.1 SDR family oxidoreductase [Cyclobacteriaceae bacterium]